MSCGCSYKILPEELFSGSCPGKISQHNLTEQNFLLYLTPEHLSFLERPSINYKDI
nr:hypothetical protein Iba_scaffold31529CG0010 [Ipomoea batatas]GMD02936.1 hypothetical protein Iba_scaffold38906CG0010 [Ipomoea batatas]GMD54754.1 hypothetical protein Iba_scaffold185404CG0010 [Ipomoea batatas]GME19449.1 hypothetical protein Iba_scaffold22898CG0010 [Ipomoea batatas]